MNSTLKQKSEQNRRQILDKLRNDKNFNVADITINNTDFFEEISNPVESFRTEIEKINGTFYTCKDVNDFAKLLSVFLKQNHLTNFYCIEPYLQNILNQAKIEYKSNTSDFEDMDSALTSCEFLIARFGTVLVSSGLQSGRQLFVYPPVHLVVARKSQLMNEPEEAIEKLQQKYPDKLPSQITFITGQSRTADIEKTLVLGAHGPKELHVFMIEE